MNWVTLSYALSLTGSWAFLVRVQGWDIERATLVVGLSGLLLPLIVLALVLPFVKPDQRQELWTSVWSTARQDLAEIVQLFRPKR